ncbi:hypothetical protein EDB19DRAFT_534397 [Suillus lakei]|nr:hypothetical protein EDB19DRAFT_534397 [Suillus lakei]
MQLEETRLKEEAALAKEEIWKKEEELTQREETLTQREEELVQREEELVQWEEELAQREEGLDSPQDLTNEIQGRSPYPVTSRGFGDIWKCDLVKPSETVQVAVKTIRAFDSDNEELMRKNAKRVRRELKVWGRLKHQSILPLWGVANDFRPYPAMICPWAGSQAFLSANKAIRCFKISSPS